MLTTLLFFIVIAVLVFVHELGHFLVAKLSGIRVDEFGIGFPPRLFGKKWGDTLYTINAIPFGGFVKIFGEDPHAENVTEEDKITSFHYKPKVIQAAVLVAGVTFNVIFAWLLISIGFMYGMPATADEASHYQIQDSRLMITEVLAGSPAQKAGLRPGDQILQVTSGSKSTHSPDISPNLVQDVVREGVGNVVFVVHRGQSDTLTITITPNDTIVPGKRAIGVAMDFVGTLKLPFFQAFVHGAQSTWGILKETTNGLLAFLYRIITFTSDFSQVSGPVGIASAVGDANKLGFIYLLSLVALISINLAVINLLPFPALDGGRLLFVIIESIIRRPLSSSFVRKANVIGFSLLIALIVVISVHDVFKLF